MTLASPAVSDQGPDEGRGKVNSVHLASAIAVVHEVTSLNCKLLLISNVSAVMIRPLHLYLRCFCTLVKVQGQ